MDFFEESEHFRVGYFNVSPLFFYAAAYLSGILTGAKINIEPYLLIAVTAFLVCLSLLLYYLTFFRNRLNSTPLKLALLVSLYCIAVTNISVSEYKTRSVDNSILKDGVSRNIKVVLTDNIRKHPNSYSLNCFSVEYGEKLIVYTDRSPDIKVGDTLMLINYRGREVANFDNKFDYRRYLEKRGIYTTAFIYSGNIVQLETLRRSFVSNIKNKREDYIRRVEKSIGIEDGLGTLVALVTGDKRYMDKEDADSYAASGAMHLMAVSGMHVVFIFAMISAILSFLGNSLPARVIRAITTMIIIVIFCAIADFAPSVIRAAVTIALVLISSVVNRRSSSLNSLSGSALIMTIFNPETLFDPGFQLSFAAVLSIIFINPAIESKYKAKNKIMRYIWQNISVSTSCQLGVSLISIPMFGYLPIYFLLANTLLIPLSVVIIYIASAVVVLTSFNLEFGFIFSILKVLSKLMNFLAIRIGELPMSVISVNLSRLSLSILFILLIITFWDFGFSRKTERIILLLLTTGLILSFTI